MIFKRKAKLEQYDLKIISPSLHDDPAFSLDPHSNPYSVSSLSPPPPGHPVLKNNKKRPNIALHGTPDSDSDFQLVQPPNSPNIPGSSNPSPRNPMTTNPLTMYNKIPTISSASSMNQGFNPSVMSQGGHRRSVLKKENKQRKSQPAQPQLITSSFSSMGKSDRRRSDLSSFPGDTVVTQPVQYNEGLQTSTSVSPQILGRTGRLQDLDQIDVLDETNPWGIRIHHDGPYEVVNGQRAGHAPLGLASSNGLYNEHALQANDQTYMPPQITVGVSLNLSPGQILPRQFPVPSIQFNALPGPYTPRFPVGPFPPPNEPQYTATRSDVTDSGSTVRNDPPAIQETTQHDDDISSSIGMAMLKLTDNTPASSPHPFLSQAESPDEGFDFFDQHRRVPSPPLSPQAEPSRGQANQSSQSTSSTGIRPVGHLRNNSDPPTYDEHIDDRRISNEQRQLQSSSQSSLNSLTSQNLAMLAGTGPQRHFNDSDNESFLPPDRYAPHSSTISRDRRVEVAQGTQYTSPAQTSTFLYHSHRDGPPLSSVNYRNKPDVQSTHYSSSIYSSGQFPSGRRPPHHLPKRLVMPSPLNTGPPPNTAASLYDSRVPPSHSSSYVNARRFQPTPSTQHYSHRSGNPTMAPMQYHGNIRAQEFQYSSGGRKLRKKASVIVSFRPPMDEYHRNDDKRMAQSIPESKARRRLSKGRR